MPDYDEYDYPLDVDAYRNADHSWISELDDVTVHAGPPYQRMGTRAVDERNWFVIDEHADEETAIRRRLLAERSADVYAGAAAAEEAAREAFELVTSWLRVHHPERLAVDVGSVPPLAAAGLLTQDDLCLMQRTEGRWCLTSAVLCAPTYWKLADKLGHPQEAVHGPVPHFADDLADKVTRFFDRLAPGRIIARRNWGFSPHPLLFLPDRGLALPDSFTGPGDMWLRSERQTLRRMERTGAVVFGIRVQLAPMEALASHPAVCARLAAAMEGWSPELVESRGSRHGWVGETVAHLQHLATAGH